MHLHNTLEWIVVSFIFGCPQKYFTLQLVGPIHFQCRLQKPCAAPFKQFLICKVTHCTNLTFWCWYTNGLFRQRQVSNKVSKRFVGRPHLTLLEKWVGISFCTNMSCNWNGMKRALPQLLLWMRWDILIHHIMRKCPPGAWTRQGMIVSRSTQCLDTLFVCFHCHRVGLQSGHEFHACHTFGQAVSCKKFSFPMCTSKWEVIAKSPKLLWEVWEMLEAKYGAESTRSGKHVGYML